LPKSTTGGSLVFYLIEGPDDSLVFPYATVINQETGDGSYVFAEASAVGNSVVKRVKAEGRRPAPPLAGSSVELPRRGLLSNRGNPATRAR
jgi:hypothetical protein